MSAISNPREPIREIKIESAADKAAVEQLLQEKGIKGREVRFFNREFEKVEKNADKLKSSAKWSFGLAGLAGGTATGVVIAVAKGTLGAAALAGAATPLGWAVLGLLAVGGTFLLCRHLMLKYHELQADIKTPVLTAIACAVAGFVTPLAIYFILKSDDDGSFGADKQPSLGRMGACRRNESK